MSLTSSIPLKISKFLVKISQFILDFSLFFTKNCNLSALFRWRLTAPPPLPPHQKKEGGGGGAPPCPPTPPPPPNEGGGGGGGPHYDLIIHYSPIINHQVLVLQLPHPSVVKVVKVILRGSLIWGNHHLTSVRDTAQKMVVLHKWERKKHTIHFNLKNIVYF